MSTANTTPCSICGCTQTNLIDGFYYCVECGTQDTNVRETVVEYTLLGEGTVPLTTKKRITLVPEAKNDQMTDDWYRWHSLNFLLQGLANEVIECGAAPTFKTKLLWVWMRYMKKYQDKADFGLAADEEQDNINMEEENPRMNEQQVSSEEDDEEETITRRDKTCRKTDLKTMNMVLVMTFLYVALNLDKSHIQLTHLIRFIQEGRVSILHWQKHVPQELRPKRLRNCLLFYRTWLKYSFEAIRYLGMEMFKKLKLGSPVVPDLASLVDEYLQELCLPKDIKPLVHALMYFKSFDYLNLHLHYRNHIPSYELYVVGHILCAMKICFGIDGKYEHEVSEAVEKINEIENHPRSYNSEPTNRLFSFREWFNYLQFRKSLLWEHTLHLGAPNYMDMNDYVGMEHQSEKPDFKKTLRDEIARDIIDKLPKSDINVIPKSEFQPTTTPYTSSTRVVIDHIQDPEIKKLLQEDFTQYSLNYILKDWFLVDPDSEDPKNILTGVKKEHFRETFDTFKISQSTINSKGYNYNKVYVKDCDNFNWMTTRRPKTQHVDRTKINSETDENENERDLLVQNSENELDTKDNSNISTNINCLTNETLHESNLKGTSINSETSKVEFNDIPENYIEMDIDESKIEFNTTTENDIQMDIDEMKHEKGEDNNIREEDKGVNIFDDDFFEFDSTIKEEKEPEGNEIEIPSEDNEKEFHIPDVLRSNEKTTDYFQRRDSEESSDDSLHITPQTLDRNAATKELVIHACNKYRISLPGIYSIQKKTTLTGRPRPKIRPHVEQRRFPKGSLANPVKSIVEDYYSHIQKDLFVQMSSMVQSAIANFNEDRTNVNDPMEIDNSAVTGHGNDTVLEEVNTEEPNIIPGEESNIDVTENLDVTENDQYKLFNDSSEGETQAEELLPKKNPEYDERTRDISQLFLKPDDSNEVAEMELNDKLFKIIDDKISKEKDNEETSNSSSPELERKDPDDDVPLSDIKELQDIRNYMMSQKYSTKKRRWINGTPSYIRRLDIPHYNYWIRHYIFRTKACNLISARDFSKDIKAHMPSSFLTILKEFADILGYSTKSIYGSMQRVEIPIKERYANVKKIKRHTPKYMLEMPKKWKYYDI